MYCRQSVAVARSARRRTSAELGYQSVAAARLLRSRAGCPQRGQTARARVMASDADIVRCAAPWPGTAARLLEGLATLGPGTWSLEQICHASASGTELGHAAQVLAGLAASGVCTSAPVEDTWLCEYAPAELLRLAHMLTGADHVRRMRINPAITELAVTMPLVPSYLEKELATTLGRPGGFLTTSAAFTRLAQAASRRLVVMTPFIDPAGF